ncbi:MAG: HAMP domain-containing sensor histidine kinase [Tissierellia bacterium]|nr:HAMP domain-containing sensor histidine kinase [Tissierellia bacterium]
MKSSLKGRIVKSSILLVFITLFILDALIIFGFQKYTFRGLESVLRIQIDQTLDTYADYIQEGRLEDLVEDHRILIWDQDKVQVQIINREGDLIYDSIGAINDSVSQYEDVNRALLGEPSIRTGKVDYAQDSVMSVSQPLIDNRGRVVGLIRLTSSLGGINQALGRVVAYLLATTGLVALISVFFSLILARSMTRSIRKITHGAELMVDGYYKTRIEIEKDDELGQLAGALNSLAEEILRKDQIKNDFISSISHELRTPLTSIKGWAVVLKDMVSQEDELVEEGLEIIENESDRLSKMVEDLLNFSRYVSGRITLEKDVFNITETCREIARQMTPRANNEGISFKEDLYAKPVLFSGDQDRIRQLLINLIDNAIKFTEEGGWVLLETEYKGDFFNILVSDNGVGIPEEDLAHVKDKFYKGRHSNSHSGLGLSISDEIAKLHNGRIDIVSQVNVGTTIRVQLPLEKKVEG